MLKVEGLHVYYGAIHAVKGIDIEIPEGSIVTLIGANGAGKSSTIRAVSGLIKSIKGKILYSPSGASQTDLAGRAPEEIVKLGVAMSPEGRRILPHLTVEENLQLGAFSRNDKDGIERDRDRVYSLFPRLKERSWQKGGTLSGGEQQMLALGRALMCEPKLVMLDEPSLGLAPILVKEVFDIIGEINSLGKTVLLVEQNAFAALKIASYAYILEVGRIVLQGRGEDLLKDPRVKEAYLGG
ncbi:MAG: ABC transporter ATP-binding protein [Synergistota bacterium]|jgi:branched-chain amino acid transport system ATP-binding protein|nr:ABC transporter ATP-binding protein [Synergistota bacterium]OPZ41047.1 MAG: High-affinity branched-chain amino acid transport ATP-binding protein LivF [Synergistetes bacterium ADurb.BinA166]